jgi:hypothetical protein
MPLTYPTEPPPKAPSSFCIVLLSVNGFYFNLKRKENKFFTTSLYKINRLLDDRHLVDLPNDPDNAELI